MRFSEYMNEWLYGEGGYYRRFDEIGKSGDFYTAVSTSAFFGASIANFLWGMIEKGDIPRDAWLVEVGAHRGYLIADMIRWLYTCDPSLIETMRFGIVERQPEVQAAQKAYLKSQFGDDVTVRHFTDLSEIGGEYGFVVANEIFDAFPCELYMEGKMAEVQAHRIFWREAPEEMRLWAQFHRLEKGEIAVGYEDFAASMAKGFKACDFVTFDYGEKYVRNDFSIRLYSKHETFPLFDEAVDLKASFRRDDITYDVNFTHVAEAFVEVGFEEVAYETQARALVRFGIIDILERYAKQATQAAYLREAGKIKTLLSPTIMGDRFKMIHLRSRN